MEFTGSNMKNFLTFQKTEALKNFLFYRSNFLSSINKKNPPEKISYTSGNGYTENISYIFIKETFLYISGNRNPEKSLYISGNRNPKKLFIF